MAAGTEDQEEDSAHPDGFARIPSVSQYLVWIQPIHRRIEANLFELVKDGEEMYVVTVVAGPNSARCVVLAMVLWGMRLVWATVFVAGCHFNSGVASSDAETSADTGVTLADASTDASIDASVAAQ